MTPPVSLQPSVARAIKRQATFQAALHGLVAKLRTSSTPARTVTTAKAGLKSLSDRANVAWRAAGLLKCAG